MRTISCFLISFMLLVLCCHICTAEDVFLIESVPIDISSESASISREQAIVAAHRKAWNFFIARVVSTKDRSKIGSIKDQTLTSFVESFSLNAAKHSSTRYIGDFKIGFHKGRVDQFFQSKGIPYIKTKGPKLLVIPILKRNGKVMLWEESNNWMQAWKNFKHPNGLIDVIVPLGDLSDEKFLDRVKAMQLDHKAFLGLIRHYQVDDVMLTVAEPEGTSLKITTHICPFSQASEKTEVVIEGHKENLWEQGVFNLMDTTEDAWRKKYLESPLKAKLSRLTVEITSPQDLERVLQDLKRFPAIQDIKIDAISCKAVILSLTHLLSEDALNALRFSLSYPVNQ